MADKKSAWTPYGLEAIRVAHLRRRRLLALLLVAGLVLVWLTLFDTTTTKELQLQVNGREGSSISIDTSDADEKKKDGPVTVGLSPGRVTRADTAGPAVQGPQVSRANVPTFDRASPYNWGYYLLSYGPWVLIGLAAWFLAKRKPKDEVNYGIYKGAMPLEMITAAAAEKVLTTRMAEGSVFGKGRSCYLPAEVMAAGSQEEEP